MLNGVDIQGLESVDLHLIPPTSPHMKACLVVGTYGKCYIIRDVRLPQRCRWGFRPSGMLRGITSQKSERFNQLHNSIIWKVLARNSLSIPKNSCEHLLVYYSRDITMPNLTKFSHTRARTIHSLVQKLLQTIATELHPPPIHTTFRKARLRLVFPPSL